MKRYLLQLACFLCLVLLISTITFAQSKTVVQGKIVDENRKPVQGVTIAEHDAEGRTLRAARSDVEGNFSISVSNTSHKLHFSHISFKSLELSIGTRTTFNVAMESNAKDLGAVVITASPRRDNGMVPIPEKNLTTAQSRISAKEMEEMQAASIDQALQGRLPGVDIAASSGDPGAGMQIRIRGTSSINSSVDPLIVVDGMPFETQIPSDFNFGTADDVGYAQLLNIAPSDIREISILKDAAATAVWGSRAANGVVVIATKRGIIGRPSLTYSFKGSVTRQPDMIPMLSGDQYSTFIPEMFMNATGTPLNTQTIKEFTYDPNDPYWFYNYSNNSDWIQSITQTGYAQDHNMSMTGGGEKARYFAR
jgi:TonB-dependent SusC/RagA subfamily outer membrane receptor